MRLVGQGTLRGVTKQALSPGPRATDRNDRPAVLLARCTIAVRSPLADAAGKLRAGGSATAILESPAFK